MQDEELDDIVQRLAVAKYALAAGDVEVARDAVDAALEMARRLLSADAGAGAGSMVRSEAARER